MTKNTPQDAIPTSLFCAQIHYQSRPRAQMNEEKWNSKNGLVCGLQILVAKTITNQCPDHK